MSWCENSALTYTIFLPASLQIYSQHMVHDEPRIESRGRNDQFSENEEKTSIK